MSYREGRVTKAEGNPNHAVNRGKLCIRGQSSVQGLYDRDRLKEVLVKNEDGHFSTVPWGEALRSVKQELVNAGQVLVLSDLQTGSLAGAMENLASAYHGRLLYYEAFNYESMRRANREVYGEGLIPRFDLEGSDLIVSFGVDFLETWLSPVEHTRIFSDFHHVKNGNIGKMIYLGPVKSMTAINSDEFIQINPGTEAAIILALIERLRQKGVFSREGLPAGPDDPDPGVERTKLDQLAEAIARAKAPVILAGRPEDASAEGIQAVMAANLLNELLGNRERMDFSAYHALSKTAYKEEVRDFFSSVTADTVLVIHQTNPVYSEPWVTEQLQRAGKVIFLGTMYQETADLADYILPVHSPLEDWGDYEPWKGTISLMQATMKPVFQTQSAGDLFLEMAGEGSGTTFKDLVRKNWKNWSGSRFSSGNGGEDQPDRDEDRFFREVLRNGTLHMDTERRELRPEFNRLTNTGGSLASVDDTFYFQLSPSLFFYDGRLSNRNWLQEIPHPVSNIVWQSWMDMNAEKARAMDIEDGEILKVTSGNLTLDVVVRLRDDMATNILAMDAGQGHWMLGKTANKVGVNAFYLFNAHAINHIPRVTIQKTGRLDPPLYVHPTLDQDGRELLRHEELEKIQDGTAEKEEISWPLPEGYLKDKDLYKPHEHKEHRWGMVIDLQSCIGCKACEAACYAENNVPVVGRKNVAEGREMSWLKVVPYQDEKQQVNYLPTPCQHCDSAPCEPVCPVFASVHTEEGLNAQIYNRCIGTRYCSNNCPYKVRRFNWSNIKHEFPENLQLNPEVTVRSRGVMEKCTFCVQRIKNKEHQAIVENRELRDGDVVPACAQTCPANAIVFGDLMDENSKVRKLMGDGRRYQLLRELNTKPAVIYLKKIDQKI